MKCYRCESEDFVKAGIANGHQRYHCKGCSLYYTRKPQERYSKEVKECALRMVADGMGFRQVERALGVSHVSVMKWVRAQGEKILRQAHKRMKEKHYEMVELDELCTFIQSKKDAGGCGFLLIELADASLPTNLAAVIRQP